MSPDAPLCCGLAFCFCSTELCGTWQPPTDAMDIFQFRETGTGLGHGVIVGSGIIVCIICIACWTIINK